MGNKEKYLFGWNARLVQIEDIRRLLIIEEQKIRKEIRKLNAEKGNKTK